MSRKSNFTEGQKAQIYVRDRATCAFSGKSLWILDYGATPYWEVDWADHIRPVARGGASTVENGICASFTFNSKKSHNTRDSEYFFHEGKPTPAYFYFFETVPVEIVRNLKRFANLHLSDWYFNRALYRVLLGVDHLWNRSERVRDADYYASSAMKAISKWRMIRERESILSMEDRGLIRSTDLSADQELLLGLCETTDKKQVREMMTALLRHFGSNYQAVEDWLECETITQATELLNELESDVRVSPRVIENIKSNMRAFEF